MSKYFYVGLCKGNYAVYVKKNMPHDFIIIRYNSL